MPDAVAVVEKASDDSSDESDTETRTFLSFLTLKFSVVFITKSSSSLVMLILVFVVYFS